MVFPGGMRTSRPVRGFSVQSTLSSSTSLRMRSGVSCAACQPGRAVPPAFYAAARELTKAHGAAPHLGDGQVRQGYVHIDDLVWLYVLALERATAGTSVPR